MGKSSAQIEVTAYYMSEHFGICAKADALVALYIKEKLAWSGDKTTAGVITLDDLELFGGFKKEGGILGEAYYLPGDADQILPDNLAQKLGRAGGADCPGFRGLASLFFYGGTGFSTSHLGFYWTANTPYLPSVWITVRRSPIGASGGGSEPEGEIETVQGLTGAADLSVFTGYDTFRFSPDGQLALGFTQEGNSLISMHMDRGNYDVVERSFEDLFGYASFWPTFSNPVIDNEGTIYAWERYQNSPDPTFHYRTWKFTNFGQDAGIIVGVADDLVDPFPVEYALCANWQGDSNKLIYRNTGILNAAKFAVRDLDSGIITKFDPSTFFGEDMRTMGVITDAYNDAWAYMIPVAELASLSHVYMWRLIDGGARSDIDDVQIIEFPATADWFIYLGHVPGQYVMRMTTDEMVLIDDDTFEITDTVNITDALGPNWFFPRDGASQQIITLDRTNQYLYIITYDGSDFVYPWANLALNKFSLVDLSLVSTIDFTDFSPLPPNAASYDYLVNSLAWSDVLGGFPSFQYAAVEQHNPTSVEFLFLGEAGGGGGECMIGPDANPSCIIYECLTNTDWGMGSPDTAINLDSFNDARATLTDENFGLSMIWTRQSTIEDFIQEVLDHIQGVLYVDPSTGLLTLALIRADYDPDTLPILTPSNAELSNFSRKLWGEIINEIVVTWTNPANEQDETITVQDDSSIAIQGNIISDGRNYYGVRNSALAMDLAMRDLRSAGQPLAGIEAAVDRTQWRLRPASVIKVTWPEYSLSEVVFRVQSVDYGKPGDPTIKLTLVEDVFGLDIGSYDQPQSSEWVDPSADPEPIEDAEIFTLPLFMAMQTTVAAFVDSPEYPEVVSGVLATTEEADTFAIELWDERPLPNGDLQWRSISNLNVIGEAQLVAALPAEAESPGITFDSFIGRTAPTAGGFAIIGDDGETGNEIAMVDGGSSAFDLVRGVLDTVPRAWPAGTKVRFVDRSTLIEDTIVRAAGELVDYKLLSRTSKGLLSLGSAPLISYTLSERPWLPNRPANVTLYGEGFSKEVDPIDARLRPDPWVTAEWAERNRLEEDSQVLAWTDATQTPEVGQTTKIEVYADDGVTLLATHDGLTGTSFDIPDADFGAEDIVRVRFSSERSDDDGDFVSLQFYELWLQIAGDSILLSGDATDGDDLLLMSGDGVGRIRISEA